MKSGYQVEKSFVQITFPYHRREGEEYVVYAYDSFDVESPHRILRLPAIAVVPLTAQPKGELQCLIPYHLARRINLLQWSEAGSA